MQQSLEVSPAQLGTLVDPPSYALRLAMLFQLGLAIAKAMASWDHHTRRQDPNGPAWSAWLVQRAGRRGEYVNHAQNFKVCFTGMSHVFVATPRVCSLPSVNKCLESR